MSKCTPSGFKKKQDDGKSLQPLLRGRTQVGEQKSGTGDRRVALRLLWDKGQRKEPRRQTGQEGLRKGPTGSTACLPGETVMQDPLLPLPQSLLERWHCFLLGWNSSGEIGEGLAQNQDGNCIGGPRAGG